MKKPRLISAVVAATVCLGLIGVAQNVNADTAAKAEWTAWTERTPPADTSDARWNSIAYGNGTFVAVATQGTKHVMTSTNGVDWTARDVANSKGWKAVTFGNDLFVAVSAELNGKTNLIMTSPNGIDWTIRPVTTTLPLNATSIAYGGGKFVAIGSNYFLTSQDGITWTNQQSPSGFWRSITYGKGAFVVVGQSGTNRVLTSANGTDWTAQAVASGSWSSVAFGGDRFVAIAGVGSPNVMTSTDGTAWETSTAGADDTATLSTVAYGKNLFVALASQSFGKSVFTSTDGKEWTARTSIDTPGSNTNSKGLNSLVYANDMFVAVADGGIGGGTLRIMTTSDPLATAPTTTTTTVAAKKGASPATGAASPAEASTKPLTIPATNGPNARIIARRVGVPVPEGAKARTRVAPESKKICRISKKGNLLSIKSGTCVIFLTVTPLEGKPLITRHSFQID